MERLSELTARMRRVEQQGQDLAAVWMLARCRGDVSAALAEAEASSFGKRYASATQTIRMAAVASGDTTTSGWASELLNITMGSEWVSTLMARTIIGQIGARRVPFNVQTPVEAAPGSAAWVAAGEPIPVSKATLDAATLPLTKVGALAVFTEELFRELTPAVAANLNASLMRVAARYMDVALLDPELSEVVGKQPASVTNGVSPRALPGNTESAITAGLLALLQVLDDAGADPADVRLVMHPRSALFMSTLLTTGGSRAFPNLGMNGGEVLGVPVLVTRGAIGSGSPTERLIVAVNAAGILLADDGQTTVSAARATSIAMDSAPSAPSNAVSMFQTNSVAIKVRRYLHFKAVAGAVAYSRVTF